MSPHANADAHVCRSISAPNADQDARPSTDACSCPCTLPFVREVVRQVAYPLGAGRARCARHEQETEQRIREMLDVTLSADTGTRAAAARRLAADPELLAAFFQNLDLLHHDCELAPATALLTADALAALDEAA